MGVSLEDLKDWLVQGRDDARKLVDLRWEVLEEKRDERGRLVSIRVTHPKVPINLLVMDTEAFGGRVAGIPYFRLVVETGVKTADLAPGNKLSLYRRLLSFSKMPLAKFYTFGEDDEIGIAADLDKRSLSKDEFNDALAAILFGYTILMEEPGISEELMEKALYMLLLIVNHWREKGLDRDDVKKELVGAGVEEELAAKLVNAVYGGPAKGGEGDDDKGGSIIYT